MSLTLFITLLLIIFTTGTNASLEGLIPSLKSKNITSVHLPSPNPELISLFSETNISLLLSIPNSLIPTMSSNTSAASAWLSTYVAPFVPQVHISAISVGDNVTDANLLKLLVPAIHNVKQKVEELGFERVKVSTTVPLGFVAKGLLASLSEKGVATLFVNVKHSIGSSFKEVVCGEFVLKRDLSSVVSYVSLGNGDYGVVEVKVSKAEEDMVNKDEDDNLMLFILIVAAWIIYMFCFM